MRAHTYFAHVHTHKNRCKNEGKWLKILLKLCAEGLVVTVQCYWKVRETLAGVAWWGEADTGGAFELRDVGMRRTHYCPPLFYMLGHYAIIHKTALLQHWLPTMMLSLATGPKLQSLAIMEQASDIVTYKKPFLLLSWYSQVFTGGGMQLTQGPCSRKTHSWFGN